MQPLKIRLNPSSGSTIGCDPSTLRSMIDNRRWPNATGPRHQTPQPSGPSRRQDGADPVYRGDVGIFPVEAHFADQSAHLCSPLALGCALRMLSSSSLGTDEGIRYLWSSVGLACPRSSSRQHRAPPHRRSRRGSPLALGCALRMLSSSSLGTDEGIRCLWSSVGLACPRSSSRQHRAPPHRRSRRGSPLALGCALRTLSSSSLGTDDGIRCLWSSVGLACPRSSSRQHRAPPHRRSRRGSPLALGCALRMLSSSSLGTDEGIRYLWSSVGLACPRSSSRQDRAPPCRRSRRGS